MPVVAIINRKGGSGKSTLATHLAAYAANTGLVTMLGDIDRQHSSKTWLTLRKNLQDGSRPDILTWAVDVGGSLHPPHSAQCVVLDTPGGLYGLELAKVVMVADVILMPVCNSIFDRESAAMCLVELKQLPKIKLGRCKLGVVGMRIDSRSHGANDVAAWAQTQGVEYIAHIRDTTIYVKCAERGLTIFDLLPSKVSFDVLQWQPILNWLKPLFDAASAFKHSQPTASAPSPLLKALDTQTLKSPGLGVARDAHQPLAQRLTAPPYASQALPSSAPLAAKKTLLESLGLPSFLTRKK